MTTKPILILKTGRTVQSVPPEAGDFEHWIMAGMRMPDLRFRTVSIFLGEPLPDVSAVAAVVITGSAAMVTDAAGWMGKSAAFLERAMAAGIPILGICFGHQLLAHMLGGKVDFNPRGREIGTTTITLAADAGENPLFSGLPPVFAANVSHSQSVIDPPAGARVMACNGFDPHHGLYFAERVWGVQFHPEFDDDIMRLYIRDRYDQIVREGLDADVLFENVRETPEAALVLENFARICGASNPSNPCNTFNPLNPHNPQLA